MCEPAAQSDFVLLAQQRFQARPVRRARSNTPSKIRTANASTNMPLAPAAIFFPSLMTAFSVMYALEIAGRRILRQVSQFDLPRSKGFPQVQTKPGHFAFSRWRGRL